MVTQKRRGRHDTPKPAWNKAAARKKLDELAREQGVGDRTPDYEAIATQVWPTKASVEEFDQWFQEIRRKGTSVEVDD